MEILLPEDVPATYTKRAILWNAMKVEKSKNAQQAREIEVSLSIELNREQQLALDCNYIQTTFVGDGMCADLCLYDINVGNPHFHMMLTLRPFEQDGSWGVKQRKENILDENRQKIYENKKRPYKCNTVTDWNEQTKTKEWHASWAASAAGANVLRYSLKNEFQHFG